MEYTVSDVLKAFKMCPRNFNTCFGCKFCYLSDYPNCKSILKRHVIKILEQVKEVE